MSELTDLKLEYLKGTKLAIWNALIAKGQTVSASDTFRSYAEKIAAIEGKSPELKWVTFMSHDGAVELGKKAVAAGDDCADPIARGVFATPTKTSTAQYSYTFLGWSKAVNGGLDDSALSAVTTDRTVYAAYAEATRFYTVRFWDGSTLLATQQVAYGGAAEEYLPTKDGFFFTGWEPGCAGITQDTDCYAQWNELPKFATATWSQIAEISRSGMASTYFKTGDTKTIRYRNADGSATITGTIEIVGFDHDDLADGSGKAGISMIAKDETFRFVFGKQLNWGSSLDSGWGLPYYLNNSFYDSFDADLQAVIKSVTKKYSAYTGSSASINTRNSKVWIPSVDEIGLSNTASTGVDKSQYLPGTGDPYEKCTLYRPNVTGDGASDGGYWLRDGSKTTTYNQWIYSLASPNRPIVISNASSTYVVFGFCV